MPLMLTIEHGGLRNNAMMTTFGWMDRQAPQRFHLCILQLCGCTSNDKDQTTAED